jgi:methylmalonyl-CoA/ethylmalonyl-CoA epimerase
MTDRTVLDHVSFAVERAESAFPLLHGALGGVPAASGDAPGFRFTTFRYAGGMQIELLEPVRIEENDFVRTFLDARGPGMHHLTFRVPDLTAALDDVAADGFPVLYSRRTDPEWQEAFLHPSVTGGTVVQLVEYPGKPAPATTGSAALQAVEWTPRDRERALRLLGGPLGGTVSEDGVRWPGLGVELRLRSGPASPARLVFAAAGPVLGAEVSLTV